MGLDQHLLCLLKYWYSCGNVSHALITTMTWNYVRYMYIPSHCICMKADESSTAWLKRHKAVKLEMQNSAGRWTYRSCYCTESRRTSSWRKQRVATLSWRIWVLELLWSGLEARAAGILPHLRTLLHTCTHTCVLHEVHKYMYKYRVYDHILYPRPDTWMHASIDKAQRCDTGGVRILNLPRFAPDRLHAQKSVL